MMTTEQKKKQKQRQEKQSDTSLIRETGRMMPQACDLEKAVLGAILLEKTAFETASSIISGEMFYNRSHELIWDACTSLAADRKPIDILTIYEQLRKDGNFDAVGGASYVANLSQTVVSSAHLEYHCEVLKDKYLHRRLIEVCSESISLGFDEAEDVDETIAKLNTEVERMQESVIGKSDTSHISAAAEESINRMHVRIANRREGITPGIPTGFIELDRLTNGWQPEKFIVLAARPGVGKTSIAIKFASKAAKCGTPVVIFSLEMGKTELTDKMIIAEAQINADAYNSGEIHPDEWNRAETATDAISRLPIYIDDNPKATVGNIANKARLLKKQGKCGMVIVDYLQLITPNIRQGRNREQEVSEMSRLLKIHAKELKVPFIVLCQMNREIENDKKNEPQLSHLRESGSLEQDADIVIFLTRPGMGVDELRYEETNEILDKNYINMFIKKHRGGKLGKVKIKHNDSMTDFYDWDYRGQARHIPQPQREITNYYEPAVPF
ncbi:MAG: replicative DNA helicase [Dysgonamonadaceae bacterium]|jgi:replicative DNA helicase|nr:replicative DNA helicase [Dysgonamonadaceae bacterium]